MGNTKSKQSDEAYKIINEEYAKILLKLNIIDIEKLTRVEKCNENVIFLQDLLKKNNPIFLNTIHSQIYNDEKSIENKMKLCKEIAEFYIKIANIYASIKTVFNKKTNKYCDNIFKHIDFENIVDIDKLFINSCDLEYGIFSKKKLKHNYYDNRHSLDDKDFDLKSDENKYFLNKRFNIFTLDDFKEVFNIFKPERKSTLFFEKNNDISDSENYRYEYKIGDIIIDYNTEKKKELKNNCDLNAPYKLKDYNNNENIKNNIKKTITNIIKKDKNYNEIIKLSQIINNEKQKLIKILEMIFTKTNNKYHINTKLKNDDVDKLNSETRGSLKKIYLSCYEIYNLSLTLITNIFKLYSETYPKIQDNDELIKEKEDYFNHNNIKYSKEQENKEIKAEQEKLKEKKFFDQLKQGNYNEVNKEYEQYIYKEKKRLDQLKQGKYNEDEQERYKEKKHLDQFTRDKYKQYENYEKILSYKKNLNDEIRINKINKLKKDKQNIDEELKILESLV